MGYQSDVDFDSPALAALEPLHIAHSVSGLRRWLSQNA